MASDNGWLWDPARQDYYYVTQDAHGSLTYHYYKDQQTRHIPDSTYPDTNSPATFKATASSGYAAARSSYVQRPRVDSSNGPAIPDPVDTDVRAVVPHLILGTPETGWYEPLDSSYRMRTGAEVYDFFKVGKVFAMLHIQAASFTPLQAMSDNITVVKYGEHAFSQIRRFVVVEVRRGFVYACPITTYNGRGTLKAGCVPSEHSAVYIKGSTLHLFPGEQEAGLTKHAIAVEPANRSIFMNFASRLHYAKVYPVEMNVKVKDIGDVVPEDMSYLIQYYKEKNNSDLTGFALQAPKTWVKLAQLEFESVTNPKAFFKKGRVFITPWLELAGQAISGQTDPPVFVKNRAFAVIRPQNGHCTCLPITAYEDEAARKQGSIAKNYAAVVAVGESIPEYPDYIEKPTKSPLFVKIESESPREGWYPNSLINFAKVYTIENNVKIRNVGRLIPESIHQMGEHFKECLKLGTN